MIRFMLTATALVVSAGALAKIPPPTLDEAAKAKAAETAAKTAWQAKIDAYKTCKVQDRIAAQYKSKHPAVPAAAATPGTPAPTAAAGTSAAPAAAAAKPMPTNASASQGGSTPVAAVTAGSGAGPSIPNCSDPGPFAYAPPEQKPLETSGAHSPAANATSPPSVRPNSAEMAPTKPGVTSSAPASTGAPTPKK